MLRRTFLIGLAITLAGCSSLGKEFNNSLVCTPEGKAFFVSMYGPIGVASKIDNLGACPQGAQK